MRAAALSASAMTRVALDRAMVVTFSRRRIPDQSSLGIRLDLSLSLSPPVGEATALMNNDMT